MKLFIRKIKILLKDIGKLFGYKSYIDCCYSKKINHNKLKQILLYPLYIIFMIIICSILIKILNDIKIKI